MKKIIIVCLTGFLYLAVSCYQQDGQVKEALSLAGENRKELEKVLEHYKEDSLKLAAACFLIGNMPGAYGYDTAMLEHYAPFYDEYDSLARLYEYQTVTEWGQKVDSLWADFDNTRRFKQTICNDLERMKAKLLIDEIELAFTAWKSNVYSQGCSFEDFCEYILPYRRLNGLIIDDARKEFYRRHAEYYFTQQGKNWQQEIDSLLYEYHHLTHSAFWGTQIPVWTAGTFEKLHHGLCMHRCWYNSLLLSSLGMPVAIDFVPAWGNRNNSHAWNVIIIGGQSYAFEAFWDEDRWKYKRIYNNRAKDELWGKFRLPKVYRHTYSNHIEGPPSDKEMDVRDIPALFCNFKKKDVSSEYFETADVTVELTEGIAEEAKYAYLAVWGYQEWHPVQWGKIKDGKAVFHGMGKDIVYLPVYYRRGVLVPAAVPFWLKEDGKIVQLVEGNKNGQVVSRLVTGAPAYDNNREYMGGMRGLRVLGISGGKLGEELCIWPDSMVVERSYKAVVGDRTYRYIRLQLPSDSIALGELAFYAGEERIKNARVITPLQSVRSNETPEILLDGADATAYCGKTKAKVVDIDLGKPYRITKIGLAPYLKSQLGSPDEFELFYWKNRWITLGVKKADNSGYLVFDNVPEGVLMMLKNRRWTGKSSERTFLYEDGSARWQ